MTPHVTDMSVCTVTHGIDRWVVTLGMVTVRMVESVLEESRMWPDTACLKRNCALIASNSTGP
jgi:hypothetical protein